MRIKNKTELRKEILIRDGSTGLWDNIWFWNDGSWSIYGQSTIPNPENERPYIVRISEAFEYYVVGEISKNSSISSFFREIENYFNSARGNK